MSQDGFITAAGGWCAPSTTFTGMVFDERGEIPPLDADGEVLRSGLNRFANPYTITINAGVVSPEVFRVMTGWEYPPPEMETLL